MISAVISSQGKPFKALMHCVQHQLLVTSAALMAEITTRLDMPRIAKRADLAERQTILDALRDSSRFVVPVELSPTCRDRVDDVVLGTALAGNADCIVTGDDDQLVLDPFQGIRILAPADFLSAIGIGS